MRAATSPESRQRLRRRIRVFGVAALLSVTLLTTVAAEAGSPLAAPASLSTVIENIRDWLVGLLVALATLFLTIGGVRYMLAGGSPGEVAKARNTLKYAALGYALAALAPLLVSILKQLVGA